jgi:hypothetical protein
MGRAVGYSIVVALALFGASVLWLSMPIFLYPLVTPLLSDVLQRPAAVPAKGARADYYWKGSGVGWTWCDDVGGGSVHWSAYGGGLEASLAVKPMCRSFDGTKIRNPWDASYSTRSWKGLLFHSPGQHRSAPCQTAVSAEQIDVYARLARKARMRTGNPEQATLLAEFERRLLTANVHALEAAPNDLDACRDGRTAS